LELLALMDALDFEQPALRINLAMDAQLVDRIYESCFSPEAWPGVLHEMGQIAGTLGASLFVAGKDIHCVAPGRAQRRSRRRTGSGEGESSRGCSQSGTPGF